MNCKRMSLFGSQVRQREASDSDKRVVPSLITKACQRRFIEKIIAVKMVYATATPVYLCIAVYWQGQKSVFEA
jgi:hypothetical protein